MVKIAKPDAKNHAKAGMLAFGKGKQKLKGPANRMPSGPAKPTMEPDADDGAPPGSYTPHPEPDMDDLKGMKTGLGQSKKSKKAKVKAKSKLY